ITFYFNISMLKINRFKNTLLKSLILLLLFAFAPTDIPQGMLDALKTGNSIQLSQYFSTSIELAIPGKEDIYSNKQAELILKDFFAKHVPSGFTILHKGGKEGSQYAIGNLTTSDGNFRVTLLIKLKENKPYIHQLRFEEENAD
ncbi:MAG TPA: DUF4783 domain-containing protein, partial [Bacteroidales bacterium]|nr:DUF4783 domain-containing protein [Bacteroidales bacterium]